MQSLQVRHTIAGPPPPEPSAGITMLPGSAADGRPTPVLHLHATSYCYRVECQTPRAGGVMTVIYRDLKFARRHSPAMSSRM